MSTAKAMAKMLKLRSTGMRIRIRIPKATWRTDTDGWCTTIGSLGKNQPKLEVWFDRFPGYPERKLWAGFVSYKHRRPIMAITNRVSRNLWPVRTITSKDASENKFFALTGRLHRAEFGVPILEKYKTGETFFGIFDSTPRTAKGIRQHFCNRAVAFLEDVAGSLPKTSAKDSWSEVYPRCENRKWVKAHLARERSGYLAELCKVRDRYRCQICKMTFSKVYGDKLGDSFAEAHHLKPLGKQLDKVITAIEDLITVCSNCHRMLHRMDGNPKDWKKLKIVVHNQRRKQG
ncbi:HNH endonuclease [bacterium]|nr:HNH endonuclease [bacterium]